MSGRAHYAARLLSLHDDGRESIKQGGEGLVNITSYPSVSSHLTPAASDGDYFINPELSLNTPIFISSEH